MDHIIKPAKSIIIQATNKKLATNLDMLWDKMKQMDEKMDQIIKKLP